MENKNKLFQYFFQEEHMATFYNQATLSYNGTTTTSNITTGELLEVLSATKTALTDSYTQGSNIVYILSIVNTGTVAFTDMTVTDNLGEITSFPAPVYPTKFKADSIRYYVNGALQTTPGTTGEAPLVISGINIPAGGNATLVYEVELNEYAPYEKGSTITNTATITGDGLTTDLQASATVTAADTALLSISKSLSPTTVTENGQITYTFIIQNSGNTPATAEDDVVVTDTFNPVLNPITVTFNGTVWTAPTHYTYNNLTGVFSTLPGQITVPAATYTQDPVTGAYTIQPGIATLIITGTV